LHRLGRDPHVVERIVLAAVGDAPLRRPQLAHDLHALLEDALVVGERDAKRQVLAIVVAAAGGEIDPAVAEQVQGRKVLGHADRVVQRQHGHRRRETDVPGKAGDVGQQHFGA